MIVLITGATSGFGMSCAELFSKKGYKTILIGRRKERLLKLSKKLGVKKNLPIQLDVRDKVKVYKEIDNLPKDLQDRINNNEKNEALNLDEKTIHSEIEKYQELLDSYKHHLKIIKSSQPKRYDYRTAVLRRVEFLFYKMKKEKQQANISIRSVYMLYHTHKFADYWEDEEFGYESPLFKRIQTHRNQALKHFKHRFPKSKSPEVEITAG